MYGLKLFACKWIDPASKKQQPGTLALTATHLAFERDKPPKAQQPAALFVSFEGVTSVAQAPERGPSSVHVTHTAVGSASFVLEDDATGTQVRGILESILEARHAQPDPRAQPEAQPDGPRALCIEAYSADTPFHLQLAECDHVALIKHDPKEALWYGECRGREGYFPKSHVTAAPAEVPAALQLSPAHWEALVAQAQVLHYRKGELVCAAGDAAGVGFLFIVREGVCVQRGVAARPEQPAFYAGAHAVYGELGVLIGAPMSYEVKAFSAAVAVLRLDCRQGSPVAALLDADVALAARLFRFVAGVCALRVDAMVLRLEELRQRAEVVRQRITAGAVRRKSSRKKIEAEDEGLVVVSDDGLSSTSSSTRAPAPRAPGRRKKGRRKPSAPAAPMLVEHSPTGADDAPAAPLRLDLRRVGGAQPSLFSMLSPAVERPAPAASEADDSSTFSESSG